MLKYFYTFLFIIAFGNSFAQDFNYAVMNRKNIVHGLGYSRVINPKLILTSKLGITLESGNGKIIPTPREGGGSFGGHYLILNNANWKAATTLKLTTSYYDFSSFTSLSYSSKLAVIGGYYTTTWFFAGEIGMLTPVVSKLKFDRVNFVSPIANEYSDGWQRVSGNRFNFGIQVGYTIDKRADIILSYGINTKQKTFNSNVGSYTYLGLSFNFRFGKLIENTIKDK